MPRKTGDSHTEMEAEQDHLRKKTPHSTACWDCYRNHRGCDGLRPCKRCVALGRGPSCRDPAPIERIPRKRKRSSAKCSVTVSTKRKGIFFLVDPKIFIFPNTPARNYETCITPPSSLPVFASNSSSSSTPKKLDREFDCEKESTQTNHGEERCLRYPPQPFRSMVDSEQRFTQHLLLDQPLSSSYFTPRPATQITMEFDTPSLEDFMEEIRAETEEVIDHQKITASVFQSLLVPDDMIHLTESVFAPFGLRDSTQPFIVFKQTVDLPWLERIMQEPNDQDTLCPLVDFLLLAASPSFCKLIQYSEDEILGPNIAKMMYSPIPLPARDRHMLLFLYPQTKLRVGPIIKGRPAWKMRNGSILLADATMQHFYAADGTISFVVIGVERASFSTG